MALDGIKKTLRKVAWRARTTIGLLGFPVRAYEQSVLVCDFNNKQLFKFQIGKLIFSSRGVV